MTILSILSIIALISILFLNFSPQFGKGLTEKQKEKFEKKEHFSKGKFINAENINIDYSLSNILKMLGEVLKSNPNRQAKKNIEVLKIDKQSLLDKSEKVHRLSWFGHSSFLIEMEGKKLLVDPMFSQVAAPHPLLGKKRYNRDMPIAIEDMPEIDAVFISHDHYDHLDFQSIKKLQSKVLKFYVPLGVGNHLKSWGIEENRITEMDWWETAKVENLEFIFTPSRHSSGRAINDQSQTLWGGWLFLGREKKIAYTGDGGYGKHFKEIGEKYGSFDISIIECGQYNKLWANVHMTPEESIQAGMDLQSKLILPVHWGALTLASHDWTEPIERLLKEGSKQSLLITTPQIGEIIDLNKKDYPKSKWWKEYQ